MQNLTALMPPRLISDELCPDGWYRTTSDGEAIGICHDNLEGYEADTVYIDFYSDDPTFYTIAGQHCYSVEEVHELLNEIADNPEEFQQFL